MTNAIRDIATGTLLVMFTVLSTSVNAAAVPDFSGKWKVDAAKGAAVGGGRGGGRGTGGGLGLGQSAEEVTITQDAKTLTVDEKRAGAAVTLTYGLDGRATTNKMPAGQNAGAAATYVAAWKGEQLVVTIEVQPAAPAAEKRRYVEARYLEKDGSMVVQTAAPGQPNSRRVVYVKQ